MAAAPKIVVGIDVGTSRSGFAFSVDGAEVQLGFGGDKQPTALLLDENGHTLAFGLAAQDQYIASGERQGALQLFQAFKMSLHSDKVAVSARNGQARPLSEVFAKSMAVLRERALEQVAAHMGRAVTADECHWVVTVPAIWNDQSKLFMRRAAATAGLVPDADHPRLVCCLEPEGACVAVHKVHLNGGIAMDEKFMVLDCGGGTVDVTAHVVEDSPAPFRVGGILAPSGGPWGGTYVDQNFEGFITEFFSFSPLLSGVALTVTMLEWERQKLSFAGDTPKKLNIADALEATNQSGMLGDLVSEWNQRHPDCIPPLKHRGANNLVLPAHLLLSFFDPVITQIEAHVEALLRREELRGLNYIFLVGGFACSQVLQRRLLAKYDVPGRRLVVPPRPGMAVAHGAVIVGWEPQIFTYRVSRFSYGLQLAENFSYANEKHTDPRAKRIAVQGGYRIKNMFKQFVGAGQAVNVNDVVRHEAVPVHETQKAVRLVVYSTAMTNAVFIDDCDLVGVVRVPLDLEVPMAQRGIDVEMLFGGSNFVVRAVRRFDGHVLSAPFDFGFAHDTQKREFPHQLRLESAPAAGASSSSSSLALPLKAGPMEVQASQAPSEASEASEPSEPSEPGKRPRI